jgi:CRP/FNR family cyclic AMP-dependent transcriptional regulator
MTVKSINADENGAAGGASTYAWSTLLRSGWLAERNQEFQASLRSIARVVDVAAGQYLYHVNDESNGIFGLVHGALDVTIPRVDGEDFLIHRAEPGFWIGDLALFARQPRLVSVRSAKQSCLAHLPQDDLEALVRSDPATMVEFYDLSHRNMALALQLLGNVTVTGATERVALRLIIMHEARLAAGGDWIEIHQKYLSELVALSLQSIRRALTELEQSGLIETGYGRIRVVDARALADRCGYRLRIH